MKSTWTAIAYRSHETSNRWMVPGKSSANSQSIIDGYFFEEKAGLIWLAHRRVGMFGMNHFELVFKHRCQVLRKVSKQPAPRLTGEEQPRDGRDQQLAREGSKRRFFLATKPNLAAIDCNIAF